MSRIQRRPARLAAALAAAGACALAAPTGGLAAEAAPVFPEPGPDCKVPEVLRPVVALVYTNGVKDCGYFEDPDYRGDDGPLGLGKVLLGPFFGPDS